MKHDVTCPECGAKMVLRTTTKFRYPVSGKPRKFYGCSRYPYCKSVHGAHPDGSPLGIPANDETKKKRIEAHDALAGYALRHGLSTSESYEWLQGQMGMTADECHIGRFDADTCDLVVGLCNQGRTT
jgi:hypothetical protein